MRHALATVVIATSLVACAAVAQSEVPAPKPTEAPAKVAAEAAPPGPLAGFGWFAELAGSCWKGEHPDGKSTETQCYLAQYGRLMRGSSRITQAGAPQPVFEGDAVFAIDPAGG